MDSQSASYTPQLVEFPRDIYLFGAADGKPSHARDIMMVVVHCDEPEVYEGNWIQGEILFRVVCGDGVIFVVYKPF